MVTSTDPWTFIAQKFHPKIDGFDVGKHPLVSRLMKDVFNRRPPLPKYSMTWSVCTVLKYLKSLGQNSELTLKYLSHKLVTLLALATVGRSSDLSLLLVNRFTSSSEGLTHMSRFVKTIQTQSHASPSVSAEVWEGLSCIVLWSLC